MLVLIFQLVEYLWWWNDQIPLNEIWVKSLAGRFILIIYFILSILFIYLFIYISSWICLFINFGKLFSFNLKIKSMNFYYFIICVLNSLRSFKEFRIVFSGLPIWNCLFFKLVFKMYFACFILILFDFEFRF